MRQMFRQRFNLRRKKIRRVLDERVVGRVHDMDDAKL